MLLPGPSLTLHNRVAVGKLGAKILLGLYSSSSEKPVTLDGKDLPVVMSYVEWGKFLSCLCESSYWVTGNQASAGPDSNVDLKREDESGSGVACNSKCSERTKPEARQHGQYVDIIRASCRPVSRVQQSNEYVMPKSMSRHRHSGTAENVKGKRKLRKKVKTRMDRKGKGRRTSSSSSSSVETVTSELESSSSECESSSRGRSGNDALMRALKHYQSKREPVTPSGFDGRGRTSLKRYLTEFEDFFYSKYKGSSRQCSKLRGDYLGGQLYKHSRL
jgi:hypothetical protein